MTEKATAIVYVTKYWEVRGIVERLCEIQTTGFAYSIDSRFQKRRFHPKDYSISKEEAVAVVEELRLKKISALRKKISKIKKLKF